RSRPQAARQPRARSCARSAACRKVRAGRTARNAMHRSPRHGARPCPASVCACHARKRWTARNPRRPATTAAAARTANCADAPAVRRRPRIHAPAPITDAHPTWSPRMRSPSPVFGVAGLLLATFVLNACNRADDSQLDDARDDAAAARVDPAATNVPGETPVAGKTGTTGSNPLLVATEGGPAPYLANSAGSALYTLQGDTDGSKCDEECTRVWPP